ncbi:TPM domain-containing protein, partial [Stenotrophomonas maltophilia]|uniref:TPM domain-containing protein n=1 Tax=Stenotrophomonas maltophilia TaxID=40324 RepID=UPI000DA83E49
MRLATALLALLLWLPLAAQAQQLAPVPALDSPVVDTTGTLDAAQKQALVQQALDLQQRKGSQLQVLVVPTTQPEDIAQYTTRVFDQWQIGRKGVDDGVLLVVAKDDRRVRIEPGYGLEGAIPDAIANRVIQEYLVPRFRAGDYAGGITDATAVLVKLIDGETLPAPVSGHRGREPGAGGDTWFLALFIGVFAGSILRGVFARVPRRMLPA